MELTRRQKQVLTTLSSIGRYRWRQDELKTSFSFMQKMWAVGLVDGAGVEDDKGSGNYPHSTFWWITDKGREAITPAGQCPWPVFTQDSEYDVG